MLSEPLAPEACAPEVLFVEELQTIALKHVRIAVSHCKVKKTSDMGHVDIGGCVLLHLCKFSCMGLPPSLPPPRASRFSLASDLAPSPSACKCKSDSLEVNSHNDFCRKGGYLVKSPFLTVVGCLGQGWQGSRDGRGSGHGSVRHFLKHCVLSFCIALNLLALACSGRSPPTPSHASGISLAWSVSPSLPPLMQEFLHESRKKQPLMRSGWH